MPGLVFSREITALSDIYLPDFTLETRFMSNVQIRVFPESSPITMQTATPGRFGTYGDFGPLEERLQPGEVLFIDGILTGLRFRMDSGVITPAHLIVKALLGSGDRSGYAA